MERQAKLREARQTQMMFEVPKTFRCVRIVGKGAYGMVCEAIDRNSKKRRDGKERVAIKKIKEALYHPLDAKLVLRELKISRLIGNHPNILGIRDLIRPSSKRRMDTIYIVSDFMDTDLYRLCQSQVEFTENHVRHLLYQMLCGLSYMHSANILHRDMKTANLLVDRNFNLQICDFGLARFSSPGHEYDCEGSTGSVPEADGGPPPLTELVVTLWYRAPELVADSHYNSSIDLWAVGCIFAEMLLRRPLFPGRDHLHQLQLITDIMGTPTETDIRTIRGAYARKVLRSLPYRPPKSWRSVFPNASSEAIDLIQKLLVFDANKRLTAEEALNHPYLCDLRTPVADMAVSAPLNSEFEFDQLTSPKMMPMRQLIYDEIMLYHDPSSKIAQDRGRGTAFTRSNSKNNFGSKNNFRNKQGTRELSTSPTGSSSSVSSGNTKRGRSALRRDRSKNDARSRSRSTIGKTNRLEKTSNSAHARKGTEAKELKKEDMPTRVTTAPANASRPTRNRPSSAVSRARGGHGRPSTTNGVTSSRKQASSEDKKVKDSAGKGKDMVEFIAKEKAFLAREREELERQTKLVDRFEKMRKERSLSRSPTFSKKKNIRGKKKAFVGTATEPRTSGFSKNNTVSTNIGAITPPPLPTPEMTTTHSTPEGAAILSSKAVVRPDEAAPPRPPSRDSLRPSSRGSDRGTGSRPPSANAGIVSAVLAFEPPPRPPSRDSSHEANGAKAMPLPVPSYLDDKPEVASPVHFNANVNLAPKAASILHKDKAGSPGSEETMIRMEKKKTSPVGGALAAIKAAKAAELDDATVISTPSQKADEPNAGSNGKKKKRSPAGGGLEAVKAVREETKAAEALKVAATALSLLKSPSTIDVYSAKTEKTQSEAESSARMNSMAKRVDEAKASSEQILGNVQLKHSGKTVMDAATALDAALAGISLKSRSSPSLLPVGQSFGKKPKLLSFTNSRNTGTDISNTMGMSRPNPINKKPSRSSSSNDIALLKKNAPGNSNAHGNKKAKENKPWVFRPTELARDRRKRLEREARQNGENIECTNSAASEVSKAQAVLPIKKKKKITVCRPFNFATAGRFGVPKHKKDREDALKRKESLRMRINHDMGSRSNSNTSLSGSSTRGTRSRTGFRKTRF